MRGEIKAGLLLGLIAPLSMGVAIIGNDLEKSRREHYEISDSRDITSTGMSHRSVEWQVASLRDRGTDTGEDGTIIKGAEAASYLWGEPGTNECPCFIRYVGYDNGNAVFQQVQPTKMGTPKKFIIKGDDIQNFYVAMRDIVAREKAMDTEKQSLWRRQMNKLIFMESQP